MQYDYGIFNALVVSKLSQFEKSLTILRIDNNYTKRFLMKQCEMCAKCIQDDAMECKYCGYVIKVEQKQDSKSSPVAKQILNLLEAIL